MHRSTAKVKIPNILVIDMLSHKLVCEQNALLKKYIIDVYICICLLDTFIIHVFKTMTTKYIIIIVTTI